VFENRVKRKIFGPVKKGFSGRWRNCLMNSLIIYTPHPILKKGKVHPITGHQGPRGE
jgi:hypothetical protein